MSAAFLREPPGAASVERKVEPPAQRAAHPPTPRSGRDNPSLLRRWVRRSARPRRRPALGPAAARLGWPFKWRPAFSAHGWCTSQCKSGLRLRAAARRRGVGKRGWSRRRRQGNPRPTALPVPACALLGVESRWTGGVRPAGRTSLRLQLSSRPPPHPLTLAGRVPRRRRARGAARSSLRRAIEDRGSECRAVPAGGRLIVWACTTQGRHTLRNGEVNYLGRCTHMVFVLAMAKWRELPKTALLHRMLRFGRIFPCRPVGRVQARWPGADPVPDYAGIGPMGRVAVRTAPSQDLDPRTGQSESLRLVY